MDKILYQLGCIHEIMKRYKAMEWTSCNYSGFCPCTVHFSNLSPMPLEVPNLEDIVLAVWALDSSSPQNAMSPIRSVLPRNLGRLCKYEKSRLSRPRRWCWNSWVLYCSFSLKNSQNLGYDLKLTWAVSCNNVYLWLYTYDYKESSIPFRVNRYFSITIWLYE